MKRINGGVLALALIIIGVIASIAGSVAQSIHHHTYSSCTVEGKDSRIALGQYKQDPRIYTTCGTFEVKDSILNGEFNSADTYGRIQEGKTYAFEATGYRVGFLSAFPNIIKAHEESK